MVKDSLGRGCRSFIRVRRTGLDTSAADSEKDAILPPALVSLTLGRLSGLGTSGWRGALSAEGVQKQHLTTAKRCSSGTGRPVFVISILPSVTSFLLDTLNYHYVIPRDCSVGIMTY